METFVAIGLWAGAGLGVLAIITAITHPKRRRASLLIAALLFLPIGVAGILSVGAVFLVAAATCLLVAAITGPPGSATPA